MAQRERTVRLTHHLRECFLRAVGNDIPQPKEPSYEEIQASLRKKFPVEIQAVFDNEELRKYLKHEWVYLGNGNGQYLVHGGADWRETPEYVVFHEAREKRNAAMSKLRGVVYGVTTLKALREALPDLVKYMADEAKPVTPGLPVVAGLYDDLKALGLKP